MDVPMSLHLKLKEKAPVVKFLYSYKTCKCSMTFSTKQTAEKGIYLQDPGKKRCFCAFNVL